MFLEDYNEEAAMKAIGDLKEQVGYQKGHEEGREEGIKQAMRKYWKSFG